FVKIFYIDSRQNSPLLFKFKCTKTCTCVLLYQEQSFFVYKNVYIRLNSVRKKKYVGTADISRGLRVWRMKIRKNLLMLLLKLTILRDRKSTRLNSSHVSISYAVFCLKK